MINRDSVKQVLRSADTVYQQRDYTSATILYFKALFLMADCVIAKENLDLPKDHEERFGITKDKFPDIYNTLHYLFPIYHSTYSDIISQNTCDKVKSHVLRTAAKYSIF